MPLPTVGLVGGIVYELSVRTSGRYVHPSVNIYFAWHDFCLLSGRVGDFKEACHKYLSCKWQRIAYLNCVTNCWDISVVPGFVPVALAFYPNFVMCICITIFYLKN